MIKILSCLEILYKYWKLFLKKCLHVHIYVCVYEYVHQIFTHH